MNVHYFDHATTSRPKASGVAEAVWDFYREICASPSRSGHRLGSAADSLLARAREKACEFFGARSPRHVVFTSGATESLNLVIRSLLGRGDEVVMSSFDHNSITRPIARLREEGVNVRLVSGKVGSSDLVDLFAASFNEKTRLAVVTEASNVDGTVLPVAEIVDRARALGIPVLVDGAQSVGWLGGPHPCGGADYFAASLHKGLLGPFGLGVLVVGSDDAVLRPLKDGGTGLESANPLPTSVIPHGLETGTINAPAVAGAIPAFESALSGATQEAARGAVRLFQSALDEIRALTRIRAFAPARLDRLVPIVSLQHRSLEPYSFARILDQEFGILVRAGLQCSPARHGDQGTLPDGTVRISFGHSTTPEDARALITALRALDKDTL